MTAQQQPEDAGLGEGTAPTHIRRRQRRTGACKKCRQRRGGGGGGGGGQGRGRGGGGVMTNQQLETQTNLPTRRPGATHGQENL